MDAKVTDLTDFTDDEIRSEYEERFGAKESYLGDFTSNDLIEELQERGTLPAPIIDGLDEVVDLIAEAARASRHAAKAYQLLRDQWPDSIPVLSARQSIISGRMTEAA